MIRGERWRYFAALLKIASLPRICFHDMRHTATLTLKEGARQKIVQEMLGHSQIKITLDTHSHVLPSMQKETAAKIDALFTNLNRR